MRSCLVVFGCLASCIPPNNPPTQRYYGPPGQTVQPRYDPNSSRAVTIVGALIGPGKVTGRPWDGPSGDITPATTELSKALALAPGMQAAAVAAALTGPSVRALEPPDIAGRAELYVNNHLVSTHELTKQQDTFTPQWSDPVVEWARVDLRNAHVRLIFVDKDLANDDDVGIVDVDGATLAQAAASPGGRLSIRVAEQTHNQVLFVDITVY